MFLGVSNITQQLFIFLFICLSSSGHLQIIVLVLSVFTVIVNHLFFIYYSVTPGSPDNGRNSSFKRGGFQTVGTFCSLLNLSLITCRSFQNFVIQRQYNFIIGSSETRLQQRDWFDLCYEFTCQLQMEDNLTECPVCQAGWLFVWQAVWLSVWLL